MKVNYNPIAKHYDFLNRLVFGTYPLKAQVALLGFIKPYTHLLIIGGGTGAVLLELERLQVAGLKITYIESSLEMLKRAQKRRHHLEVHFIHADIFNYTLPEPADAVLTAFLFDNFSQAQAELLFYKIDGLLNTRGMWLYVDFHLSGKLWQRALLYAMQRFFKALAVVQVQALPKINFLFARNYSLQRKCFFYGNFINAIAYKKIKPA